MLPIDLYTYVWHRPGASNVIDFAKPDGTTLHLVNSREELLARYPDAVLSTYEAWSSARGAEQDSSVTWTEITERQFWDALGALPPALQIGSAFLLGEPFDHHAVTGQPRFTAYVQRVIAGAEDVRTERFEASSRPMTRAEFRASFLSS